ncbi:MAG: Uncharacterised protein [Synechococcus sp. CC9902]|nr:MAG: Uncharacterised protein [Synechococcus sp. CC9902]
MAVELRKAHVVADGQTHLAETGNLHDRGQLLAGINGG